MGINTDLKELGAIIGQNILWTILPLGAVGNSLIVTYFLKINYVTKLSRMSLYHFLIIILAVVDLLTSVTTSLIIHQFYKTTWHMGHVMCNVGYPFLMSVLTFISCWILVLLSYERYRSLTRPFERRATKCKYCVIICVIVLLCWLSFIPFTLKTRIVEDEDRNTRCADGMRFFDATEYVLYAGFLRMLDCFMPASLMFFFYARIRNWMNLDANEFPLTDESRKRNLLALRTLRNLIIVYVVCVFPGRLVVTGLHIDDNYRTESGLGRIYYFNFVHELFSLISLLNNVVNVIVYAVMIKDFRGFILTLVTFGRL